jgi:hypothetical protein
MSLPNRFLTIGEFKKLIVGLPDHVALGTIVDSTTTFELDRFRIVQDKETLKLGVIIGDKALDNPQVLESFNEKYTVLSADKYYNHESQTEDLTLEDIFAE